MGLVYTDGTMCRIRLYLSDQRTAKWKIQAEKCKEKLSDEVWKKRRISSIILSGDSALSWVRTEITEHETWSEDGDENKIISKV